MKRISIGGISALSLIFCLSLVASAQKDDSGLNDLLKEIGGSDAVKSGGTATPVEAPATPAGGQPPAVAHAPSAQEQTPEEKAKEKTTRGDIKAALTPPDEKTVAEAQLVAQQELIRRQAEEKKARKNIENGRDRLRAGDFDEAIKLLEEGVRSMPSRPASDAIAETAKSALVQAYLKKAETVVEFAKKKSPGDALKDMETADAFVASASKISPGNQDAEALHSRIAANRERLKVVIGTPVPVRKSPDYLDKKDSIAKLLQRGREYFNIKDLDNAEASFADVLKKDEYNAEAMTYLRKIYDLRYEAHTLRRDATTARAMDDVRREWTPPIRVEITPPKLPSGGETNAINSTLGLQKRLEGMIIPEINFKAAKIDDVRDFLDDASRQVDQSKVGVNIILNLGLPAATAANPAEGLLAPPAGVPTEPAPAPAPDATAAPATSQQVPTVTLSLRRASLLNAIKYVTEVTGLRYRLEGENTVIIYPANATIGTIITRTYPVQPSIIPTISKGAEAAAAAPAAAGGKPVQAMEAAAGVEQGDIKKYFETLGVPFPAGTSISYNAANSKLIVANTAENLEKLEAVLPEMMSGGQSQIEIETRFVEISETALEELGAEWGLNSAWTVASKNNGGPVGSTQRIDLSTGGPAGLTSGLNFFNFDSTAGNIAPATALTASQTSKPLGGIIKIAGVLTNPELQVILHALEQHGSSDLLSAPRVTTKNGQNATIQIVREIIYPTEFQTTQPQVAVGATGGAGNILQQGIVTPGSFQTRQTGVILNVIPTIGPDGYTIDLQLQPEVSELESWINYGSSAGGQTLNIPQPIFNVRKVNTTLFVWDSQTVVMGGLIREQLTKTKDKVPLLGDLPLIGRLFRSEGEYSQKRNLLIFVTARIVDAFGLPVHKVVNPFGVTETSGAAPATPAGTTR